MISCPMKPTAPLARIVFLRLGEETMSPSFFDIVWNSMIGSSPYKNGVTKAPQKCNAHVRSEHPVASTTAAGGATANVTAGTENLSLTEQYWSLENALDMMDSYSSASDMIHATHEPINAEAENAVRAAPPAPLVAELSRPPPSAAKHHAM